MTRVVSIATFAERMTDHKSLETTRKVSHRRDEVEVEVDIHGERG